MTAIPHPTVPVADDAALAEQWVGLLADEAPPAQRSLVVRWLRPDGSSAPVLVPVDGVPSEPDRALLGHLVDLHATVADEEHVPRTDLHLALYLQRPGAAGPLPEDHAWAAAAGAVLRVRERVDCSLHVGDGRTAVPLLPRSSWPAHP
ncbi:hypothetical protein SAMN03159343_3440 [Klenkia marina]|uniref:Uncharacterized protein n=1 Tax=Klenkia marina TaxID=1960309 RepID=A0A1G4YT32_9ACTN|nr:hypothetical protein [Klenkia marina]SCX56531.1 hypothetical protein SAMN03159343_3440 [Klenkia marina]